MASAFHLSVGTVLVPTGNTAVAAAEYKRLPGATRSGLIRLSMLRPPVVLIEAPRVGPRELNRLTVSSPRAGVPRMCDEPTVITDGSCPGEPMVPKVVAPVTCP